MRLAVERPRTDFRQDEELGVVRTGGGSEERGLDADISVLGTRFSQEAMNTKVVGSGGSGRGKRRLVPLLPVRRIMLGQVGECTLDLRLWSRRHRRRCLISR